MGYLYMNKHDVDLAFAKSIGLKYNLSVVHDDLVERGCMWFVVNGQAKKVRYLSPSVGETNVPS